MGLFNKKPKARFETITIEREREVFRALEKQGWILCDEPFQIDVQKSADKLRKDAISIAKDLKGELIVEIFDPIYTNLPWKGLRYAVWRRATQEEIVERMKKEQSRIRPNYGDTMSSIDDIAQKLDQKKIQVSEEDLHALDAVMEMKPVDVKGDISGKTSEELKMADDAIKAITTFNPYDHQGEEGHEMDGDLGPTGPVFQQSIVLVPDVPDTPDLTPEVDAMAMMLQAADEAQPPPVPVQQAPPPANVPYQQVPAPAPNPQPPIPAQQAPPPANTPYQQAPAPVPGGQPPAPVQQAPPPANVPYQQVPAPAPSLQPPAPVQQGPPPANVPQYQAPVQVTQPQPMTPEPQVPPPKSQAFMPPPKPPGAAENRREGSEDK